jgi:multicomponent Na+:H+ antiporter subunit E
MPVRFRATARRFVVHLLVLAGLWWLLTGGEPSSWLIGLPVVAAAAAIAAGQGRGFRLRAAGVLRFVIYFVVRSVHAGVDVSLRVLAREPRIDPRLFDCRLRLPEGPARAFLAGVLSLLPGTLTVELEQDRMRVHVLDGTLPFERDIRELEARVADLYAEQLADD